MTHRLVLTAAAVLVGATLWIVHEIYEDHRREQARCQRVLTEELRWTPRVVHHQLPADPCDAIRVVRGTR